jgi:hypothetical protein
MKINILDAHDRLQHLKKQSDVLGQYCQSIIDSSPFGNRPFYIFAHKRQISPDERIAILNSSLHGQIEQKYFSLADVPTHRMIWQPRLTKPKAQTNSMLFKVHPGTDILQTVWIIPERELWSQYNKDNLTENETVRYSINAFINNREQLEAPDDEDPSEDEIKSTYLQLSAEAKRKKLLDKLYLLKPSF